MNFAPLLFWITAVLEVYGIFEHLNFAATDLRSGGKIYTISSAVHHWLQQRKNYWNRPSFVKVMLEIKAERFYGSRCIMFIKFYYQSYRSNIRRIRASVHNCSFYSERKKMTATPRRSANVLYMRWINSLLPRSCLLNWLSMRINYSLAPTAVRTAWAGGGDRLLNGRTTSLALLMSLNKLSPRPSLTAGSVKVNVDRWGKRDSGAGQRIAEPQFPIEVLFSYNSCIRQSYGLLVFCLLRCNWTLIER